MLTNVITGVIFETFSVMLKLPDGKMEEIALCEGGR